MSTDDGDRDPPAPEDPAGSGSIDVDVGASTTAMPKPERRKRARTMPSMLVESLTTLPVVKEVMPKTKRAKVLVRSVFIGFTLVALWVGVIVYLQLRGDEPPDLRQYVETIMNDLRDKHAETVWKNEASVRFQELIPEDSFEDQITEMNNSLGAFKEVASIISTDEFKGPSGRTALVNFLLDFARGRARGNMSFLYEKADDGTWDWKMIGMSIDVPEKLVAELTSTTARIDRVAAPPEIKQLVQQILEEWRDKKFDQIWNDADDTWKSAKQKTLFEDEEGLHYELIGPFRRILNVTSARQNPGKTGASLDALLEFDKGTQITTIDGKFEFTKTNGQWKLSFFKLIMPMPHEGAPSRPGSDAGP